MSHLTNLDRFGFSENDIKIIVGYLAINPEMNKKLIEKTIKFGNYMKKVKVLKKEAV